MLLVDVMDDRNGALCVSLLPTLKAVHAVRDSWVGIRVRIIRNMDQERVKIILYRTFSLDGQTEKYK